MIAKDFNSIELEDIMSLIENKVPESETLGYKRSLHSIPVDNEEAGFKDQDRKEFYADVSSFANKSGGDLIYGVAEEKGIPTEIIGLQISNVDSMTSKLRQMISSSIEPRIIPEPRIKFLKISEPNNYIVIIRIKERSWTAPNRVTFKGINKFYIRSTNGKHEMGIEELKISFGYLKEIKEKIEKFLIDRIENIASGNIPIALSINNTFHKKGVIILHLMPSSAFYGSQYYDPIRYKDQIKTIKQIEYRSGNSQSIEGRYNIDGYCTSGIYTYENYFSYVQFFKNGIIEIVKSGIAVRAGESDNSFYIPGRLLEERIVESVKSCLDFYKSINIPIPIYLFATILGVNNIPVTSKNMVDYNGIENLPKIDRNIVKFPEIEISNIDKDVEEFLKPIFNALWNASGMERSPSYKGRPEENER